jgi:hypothetical protein
MRTRTRQTRAPGRGHGAHRNHAGKGDKCSGWEKGQAWQLEIKATLPEINLENPLHTYNPNTLTQCHSLTLTHPHKHTHTHTFF